MKANVTHHAGKGSRQEMLPNRSALSALVRGPQPASMNDYAKATPNVVQGSQTVKPVSEEP